MKHLKQDITEKQVEDLLAVKHRPIVILESPFAGDVPLNIYYAQLCVRDSIIRGEAPMASHLLYTQPNILDDDIPHERDLGIDAGLTWRRAAEKSVVYEDLGISKGMIYGIEEAKKAGKPIEYRTINFDIELAKEKISKNIKMQSNQPKPF